MLRNFPIYVTFTNEYCIFSAISVWTNYNNKMNSMQENLINRLAEKVNELSMLNEHVEKLNLTAISHPKEVPQNKEHLSVDSMTADLAEPQDWRKEHIENLTVLFNKYVSAIQLLLQMQEENWQIETNQSNFIT